MGSLLTAWTGMTPEGKEEDRVYATKMKVFFLSLLGFGVLCALSAGDDDFAEELLLRPLESGHLYSYFQFTTRWNVDLTSQTSFQHYHLFPMSLGEVLNKFKVQELHLTLTQGLWRHDKWGYPVSDSPPGAQLWVWFQEGTTNVDETWVSLINVLSGMFCASLNFMDTKTTVNPKFSFKPMGVVSERYGPRHGSLLRYALLAGENVCTENLTPWKKLLPCSSKAGLASLFNAIKLYDSSFHSLGVHFRPVCADENCTKPVGELIQSLSSVLEPTVPGKGKQDWNLRKLFDRNLVSSCPLATDSKIYVDTTSNKTLQYYFTLKPEPHDMLTMGQGFLKRTYAVYDVPKYLAESRMLFLEAEYNRPYESKPTRPPPLYAHRYLTGFGQDEGGISCLISNSLSEDVVIVYMETVPWYLRILLHSLTIQYTPLADPTANATTIKPVKLHYQPGRDREKPYHIEVILRLPAASLTKISFSFRRALLKWTEYPPDANHGFYVSSAVISALLPNPITQTVASDATSKLYSVLTAKPSEVFLRLHTESLLVSLPTPDFSMPYNVICLACTVVAIAFGSIHNLTTRRFTILDPNKKKGLLNKIKAFFRRSKKEGKSSDENQTNIKQADDSHEEQSEGKSDKSKKGIKKDS